MKLLQELNQINEDEQLNEMIDPEMIKQFLGDFAIQVARNPEVAEGVAVGVLFLLGTVFNYYRDAYYGAKEFFAKFKRIKEMKNPEQQQKELKKLSDELDMMVQNVLKDKKIDKETRLRLKEFQDEMRSKVDNMASFIEQYKENGRYPGTYGKDVDKKIEGQVSRWTAEFNKLRERVQKAVEASKTKTVKKA